MAPNLSKRVRDALDESLYNNPQIDPHEVAMLYSTTYSIVIKHRALIRRIELTGINNRRKLGYPRIIMPKILEYAIALIKRDSTLYLNEVADYLYIEFGI
jgi:hypothetical protein